jgi:hypothetical protein
VAESSATTPYFSENPTEANPLACLSLNLAFPQIDPSQTPELYQTLRLVEADSLITFIPAWRETSGPTLMNKWHYEYKTTNSKIQEIAGGKKCVN